MLWNPRNPRGLARGIHPHGMVEAAGVLRNDQMDVDGDQDFYAALVVQQF